MAILITRAPGSRRAQDHAGGWWGQLASPHLHRLWRVSGADEAEAARMEAVARHRDRHRGRRRGLCSNGGDPVCRAANVKSLGSKGSMKLSWDTLKAMGVGLDHAKKVKAQQLQQEYEALAFCDIKVVQDFALRLQSLVSQLAVLGVVISVEVVRQVLAGGAHQVRTNRALY